MTRYLASLHTVRSVPVPVLLRYYQGTATPAALLASLGCPRSAIPHGASCISLQFGPVAKPTAWVLLGSVYPLRRHSGGRGRFSQVPGEPQLSRRHVLRPRWNCRHLTIAMPPVRPPARRNAEAPTLRISGLVSMALGLAVYASSGESPQSDARLASRCWLDSPVRACTRRVPPKGFSSASYIASSFPRLSVAQSSSLLIRRGLLFVQGFPVFSPVRVW